MCSGKQFVSLGEVVQAAHGSAVKRWISDHAQGQDPEVFLTSHLLEVSTTFTVGKSGYFSIWVEVSADKHWLSAAYGYRAEKLAAGRYRAGLDYLT